MKISFPDDKTRRTCSWHLRKFAKAKAILAPSSTEGYLQLHKERGFGMQYRGDNSRTFFPTQTGWDAFVEFTRFLHLAEPFATRSTKNDTYQAAQKAFANMLSDGLLPETVEDLVAYFPHSFTTALSVRAKRCFSKVQGLNLDDDYFLRVGQCWLGNFAGLCFDAIPETPTGHKKYAIETIGDVFDGETAVFAAERNFGTDDRVEEESAYQWEFALSVLCLMINLTYQPAFGRLWPIRLLERPEHGLAAQRSFSIIEDGDATVERQIGLAMKFVEPWFDINISIVDEWHDSLGLSIFNRIGAEKMFRDAELASRLVDAVLYFRQAASQSTLEMQMSTLWISVESIFATSNQDVVKTNLNGLTAMIPNILKRDRWPQGVGTPEELRKVFKKFYDWRSRTVHQGRRGHVSWRDVEDFSVVVGAIIVGVAYLIDEGMRTGEELKVRIGELLGGGA